MTDPVNAAEGNDITQTDYLKLFMKELTYQDPLKPMDNREFMAQMAQFSSLQEARATNESLKLLAGTTSGNQSLMLLGKTVGLRDSNQSGVVTSIKFPGDSPPIINVMVEGVTLEKQILDIIEVHL